MIQEKRDLITIIIALEYMHNEVLSNKKDELGNAK
jgi:hypothetical protein